LSDEIIPLQNELKELIKYFRITSRELDLPITTKDDTPIQLLKIGNMQKMYKVLTMLISRGFLPLTASYPAIAKGEEGIRITLTRHLTKQDVNSYLQGIKEIIESEK
jgi:7-keto-8-aminopelargonate synthetase-like enzyme